MGSVTVVFFSSLFSILRILLLVTFGIILARWNILNSQANGALSKILFALFIPCIQFTNIASSISLDTLVTMVNVIAFAIFHICVGAVIGWILQKLIHPRPDFRRGMILATSISNAGTLPLAVLEALLTREPMNTIADAEPISIAYTSMYMSVVSISLWTVGVMYMKKDEKEEQNYELLHVATSATVTEVNETATKSSQEDSDPASSTNDSLTNISLDQHDNNHSTEHSNGSLEHSSSTTEHSSDTEEPDSLHKASEQHKSPVHSFFMASSNIIKDPWTHIPLSKEHKQTLKNVLTPPVIAVFVALVVGLIPPLKWIFFDENSPFKWVSEAMETAAAVVVPTSLLILGGNLANGPSSQLIEKKVVVGVCLARLVLSPLIGMCTVLLAAKIGILPAEDKILQFCLMLQTASPSALNLVLISQLTGRQTATQSMASLLFWEYVFAALSVTFYVTIFLYILF